MGGFSLAAKDIGQTVATHVSELTPYIKRAITEHIAPMETAFKESKAGTYLWNTVEKYHQEVDKNITNYTELAVKKQPLVINGSPVIAPHEIRQTARNHARIKIFGPKDEDTQFLLNAIKKEKGDAHTQTISNHLGVMFKDAAYEEGNNVGRNTLSANIINKNKAKKAEALENVFIPKNTAPYKKVGKLENAIRSYGMKTLAVHAAGPHSVSSLNTMLTEPLHNYTKALYDVITPNNYENSRMFLKSMDVIHEASGSEYNQHFAYENSLLKKVAGNFKFIPDSLGEFVHSNFSMPGMSSVRRLNVTIAAMASKYSAEEFSARVMSGTDRVAEAHLQRLGLDPDLIKKQGGHLTREQLRTAIFKGTDYSAFLENPGARSQFAQASVVGRLMFSMHGFVARQGKLYAKDTMFKYRAGDKLGVAKNLAFLALIAPEVGNAVGGLENIWRGKSTDDSENEWSKNERGMWGHQGFMRAMGLRIEAISHMAAFGVATGYVKSLARNKFADSLLGPHLNMAGEIGQDVMKYLQIDNNHPAAGDPLKRDALTFIPTAGFGGMLSHKLVPTKNDLRAHKTQSAKAQKAAETRRRKKKPSNNPLRMMFEDQ